MSTLVAFNKFEDSQREALEVLLGETVEVATANGFFPSAAVTPTTEFALTAAASVPSGALVRNSGSYWGAAAIAAAIRGRNGIYAPIVTFGAYPFPVKRVEEPQALRGNGRAHRSGGGEVPEVPIVVNMGHPLTPAQAVQASELLGATPIVVGVGADGGPEKFHVDMELELGPQVSAFIDALGVSGRAWQNAHVVVNLPGQAECAVLTVAYLEGLMGYIPSVFRVDGRKVGEQGGRAVMEFDLTEVVILQELRNKALTAFSTEAEAARAESLLALAKALAENGVGAAWKDGKVSISFPDGEEWVLTVTAVEYTPPST